MELIIDFALLAIIFFATFKGFSNGFVKTLTSTISLVLAVVFAALFHENMAKIFNLPPLYASILAFILVFVLSILFFKLISLLFTKIFKGSKFLKGTNKVLGLLLGLLLGLFYAWVISAIAGTILKVVYPQLLADTSVMKYLYEVNPLAYLNIFYL